MKKIIALGVMVVIAVLLAIFGRDLLDLYRLQSYITTSTEAYQAERGNWPHLTDACTGCHGSHGNSLNSTYPSLAGQPAAYLSAQLRNFASGQRLAPNMEPLAMTLSPDEIDQLAKFYARQSVGAHGAVSSDEGLKDQGKQLVQTRGCTACHGAQLMGHEAYPRLAAQGQDYLLAQLNAFASGERIEPSGAMQAMAAALSAQERQAIAAYLAALVPQPR
ncbi:c-type cytochrome [Pseudomonas sp. MF6751]|uniref:c-type cytochrome n=1 Tax=Pseudomonas TaxID=286 RepID=UPI0018E5CEA8|nr:MULTISPECIES: c-type cytochrome [Pseudomonas]MBI6658762.1 c-type cytochrome [Pseudomonas carnis]MBI6662513.1 c-type cytochrome [Pseudomonas carnis]MBI6686820.1 c-type cytochrome [Pseudomonas carnis]MBK3475826.1 c-type cytochrome [Pseudomonas sp. MF6751]